MENQSLGGLAIQIPNADRDRIASLMRDVAKGEAARMQIDGYLKMLAIDNGIDVLNHNVTVSGNDVLFTKKEIFNDQFNKAFGAPMHHLNVPTGPGSPGDSTK